MVNVPQLRSKYVREQEEVSNLEWAA
jgi:hypothetical protein